MKGDNVSFRKCVCSKWPLSSFPFPASLLCFLAQKGNEEVQLEKRDAPIDQSTAHFWCYHEDKFTHYAFLRFPCDLLGLTLVHLLMTETAAYIICQTFRLLDFKFPGLGMCISSACPFGSTVVISRMANSTNYRCCIISCKHILVTFSTCVLGRCEKLL